MPYLTLTEFLDIVVANPTSKATKVRAAKKNREQEYNPAFDFYKQIRERIEETHRLGKPKAFIQALMPAVTHDLKLEHYPVIIKGYTKWWGKKTLKWFDPPSEPYANHGVEVRVNAELGLLVDGKPHAIKLYFKADPLSKSRINVIHQVMADTLLPECPKGTQVAVLDVRRGKLYKPTVPIPDLPAMLSAELAYVADIWDNLS
jgi:hypothetical protein